jgi:hypothetical protein
MGPGIQALYGSRWRLLELGDSAGLTVNLGGAGGRDLRRRYADLVPHGTLNLGTPITSGSMGFTLRFGPSVPQTFAKRIGPVRRRLLLHPEITPESRPARTLYGFIGREWAYVVHNAFLDGTPFRESPSVEKVPTFGEREIGLSGDVGFGILTVRRVWRTREFKGPYGVDHVFWAASLTLSLR